MADDAPAARDGIRNALGIGAAVSGKLPAKDACGADGHAVNSLRMAAGDFVGGELAVAGKYGILTMRANGRYEYIQTKLMDKADSDEFQYTLTDREGGKVAAVLTLAAPLAGNGGAPAVTPASIKEHGVHLKMRAQYPDADGGCAGGREPAQRGSFTIDSRGLQCELEISGGGQKMRLRFKDYGRLDTDAGRSIRTGCGLLNVIGSTMDPATGLITVAYEYMLHPPRNAAGDETRRAARDVFAISVAGSGVPPVELRMAGADDAPVLPNNVRILELHAGATVWRADGNLLADAFFNSDGPAADNGLTMRGGDFDSRYGMAVIEGQYGALAINRNGQYSYILDQSKTQATLPTPGAKLENLRDEFGYSIKDDAGNISHAVLSFSLEKVQLAPQARDSRHRLPALRRMRALRRSPATASATGSRPACA